MAEAVQPGQNEPPSHHGGLENLDTEHSYWLDDVQGEIPNDLTGTFFRNGPGRQRIGDTKYGHWFDGDGMLCAFTFSQGKAHFKNAYVRTPKYIAETEAQDIKYRGFGTQVPGGFFANMGKMPANPANTNTIYHGGKLFALNEGGHPWELEPSDLSTVGEYSYEGNLARGQVFSAHGRVHPKSGDYINFGAGMSRMTLKGPQPCINIYRINPQGNLFKKGQIELDTFPFAHDFVITERYAVFFIGSIVFSGMGSVMLGRKTISDVVQYDPSINMKVYVVDLDTLETVKTFETTDGAIVHFGNAYEQGDELIIDGCYQQGFEANATLVDIFNPTSRFNGGWYKRYVLNMQTGAMTESQISDLGSYQPLDSVLTNTTASFTTAQETKLSGIETGATADQTGAEMVGAIDSELGSTDWQSGGGGGSVEAVTYVNTAYTPTIGASAAIDGTFKLPLNTTAVGGVTSSSVSASSAGTLTLQAGTYLISSNLSQSNNGSARSNVSTRFGIAGSAEGPISSCGYTRRTGGHDEASSHLTPYLVHVSSGTKTVELWIGNLSAINAGTVTMAAGQSNITVVKIA